jgi:hypothetical protein
MSEPTESAILQRAKSLCADDGYAWGVGDEPDDTEDGDVRKILDDSTRVEYLNRATVQLTREAIDSE